MDALRDLQHDRLQQLRVNLELDTKWAAQLAAVDETMSANSFLLEDAIRADDAEEEQARGVWSARVDEHFAAQEDRVRAAAEALLTSARR
jgi:hypothetical protein